MHLIPGNWNELDFYIEPKTKYFNNSFCSARRRIALCGFISFLEPCSYNSFRCHCNDCLDIFLLLSLLKFPLSFFPVIHSLRDVRVKIPAAVRKSDNVVLNCYYDMEGDSLYSVKWYKGRREFYRFSPKENPAMKTFPIAGIHVVVS